MPIYYDMHFVGALVSTSAWMCLACYDSCRPWLHWPLLMASESISFYCAVHLTMPFYQEWRRPPLVQLNNAVPVNGNAAQLQRGRLRHLPGLPRMLADVLQCLPRVGLDACQLVSRQFRDAVEEARTTLPLYSIVVCLLPCGVLVRYFASIVHVGFVTGYFFTGLRRCDSPYFRNAAIILRTQNVTYARTSTDMISAFVRWLDLDERNIRFKYLKCEIYTDEIEGLFRFTDGHDIRSLYVIYKRSLVTPGRDFLSTLFAVARKRQLSRFTVSLANAEAKDCDVEVQVGFQLLSEIFEDQKRPSAEHLTIIVPRLKGFRFLRRVYQAYTRGEITRQIKIGCVASVPLAELFPGARPNPLGEGDGSRPVTMKLSTDGQTNFYRLFLSL